MVFIFWNAFQCLSIVLYSFFSVQRSEVHLVGMRDHRPKSSCTWTQQISGSEFLQSLHFFVGVQKGLRVLKWRVGDGGWAVWTMGHVCCARWTFGLASSGAFVCRYCCTIKMCSTKELFNTRFTFLPKIFICTVSHLESAYSYVQAIVHMYVCTYKRLYLWVCLKQIACWLHICVPVFGSAQIFEGAASRVLQQLKI